MVDNAAPAAHDLIGGPGRAARVEHVTGDDAYLVSCYGDRWSVPVDQLILVRPAVRGGTPAEWVVSPEWTS